MDNKEIVLVFSITKGILTYRSGTRYEGESKDDKMDGKGTLIN